MADDKRFVRRRRIVLGTVVVGVVALFTRVTRDTDSVLAGLAVVAGVGAYWRWR